MKSSSAHLAEPWAGAPYPYMVSAYEGLSEPVAAPAPQAHVPSKEWDPASGEAWAGGPYSSADAYAEFYGSKRSTQISCPGADSHQNTRGR